ncbi:MAG TPA: hypothetical protein H9881_06805 [Candidatus Stackebrandtia excrementipullorum]|nr:hypothetical protein [Candidatus Stackebrandtia excrementipullorum]
MASIENFIAAVRSNIEALKQAQTVIDAAGQQASELSTAFQSIGAERMASGSTELKQGTEQARGSADPIIAALEDLIAQAEQLKTSTGPTPRLGRQPTPLDAAPKNLREPTAQVGDQRQAPDEAPGPFRQELTGHDEDDKTKSKFRRASRAVARNIGDLQDQAKDATDVAIQTRGMVDPPPGNTYSTVGVSNTPQVTSPAARETDPSDVVSTAIVMTAVAAEVFARRVRRRKARE